MIMRAPKYLLTYVVYNDKEVAAEVYFDTSPPEPDVNWPGGSEVEAVYIRDDSIAAKFRNRMLGQKALFDRDVTDKVADQFGRLMDEINEHLTCWQEDDRY